MTAPTSSKNNWLKKYEKLQPVPEEGGEVPEVKDTRLPEFKPPTGLGFTTRGLTEGYRQEQIQEIEAIKDRLAKDNCQLSMLTL